MEILIKILRCFCLRMKLAQSANSTGLLYIQQQWIIRIHWLTVIQKAGHQICSKMSSQARYSRFFLSRKFDRLWSIVDIWAKRRVRRWFWVHKSWWYQSKYFRWFFKLIYQTRTVWCTLIGSMDRPSFWKPYTGPACRYKGNPPRGHYDGEPCDYEHGTCVDNALGAKSTTKCIAYGPGMGPSSINNDPVDQE